MAGKGSVLINFAAKADEAIREVKKLTGSMDDIGNSAEKSDSKFSKFRGAAVTGIAAVGAALVGAGAAMVSFAQQAAEDAAAAETLANTLKSIPGITDDMVKANEEWITSMQIATLVADNDLRKAVSTLTLATGDLGEAQELTALAIDTAAGSGKDLNGVVSALSKAVNGNTSALERQFPWLDKNKDGTVTLDEAITGLGDAYKGAAEKASDKKPWDRFLVTVDELKETIGAGLLPYLYQFSDWLKNKENQRKLTQMAEDIGAVAGAVAGLIKLLWRLIDALKSAWRWLDSVNRRWQSLLNTVDRGIQWPWENDGRSSTSYAANAAPTTRAAGGTSGTTIGNVTINLQGTGYAYEDATKIKRALENYDRAQGRAVGSTLRVAW